LPLRDAVAALQPFADEVYLHQVTERASAKSPSRLRRYLDLPEALAAAQARGERGGLWRIHFHVPLFQQRLGPFSSTQAYLVELLARLRVDAISQHLEVETYTWDVLPEEHRGEDIVEAIAREIAWVRDRLEPDRSS
jgi:hypothetical protein